MSNRKRQQFCLCPLLTVLVSVLHVGAAVCLLCAIVTLTLFFKSDIDSPSLFRASENGWHVKIS